MQANRRIYTNADGTKVVDEGSPDAAILLAAPGQVIADEDARRLGLLAPEETPAPAPVQSTEFAPPFMPSSQRSRVDELVARVDELEARMQRYETDTAAKLNPNPNSTDPTGPGTISDPAADEAATARGEIVSNETPPAPTETQPDPPVDDADAEGKARSGPPANKARRSVDDKAVAN